MHSGAAVLDRQAGLQSDVPTGTSRKSQSGGNNGQRHKRPCCCCGVCCRARVNNCRTDSQRRKRDKSQRERRAKSCRERSGAGSRCVRRLQRNKAIKPCEAKVENELRQPSGCSMNFAMAATACCRIAIAVDAASTAVRGCGCERARDSCYPLLHAVRRPMNTHE